MADVFFAVVPFLSPTSAGTINVVADGTGGLKDLGGLTPKAVIIVGGGATDSDTVETADTRMGVGFAVNGGGQNCMRYWCNDAATTSQTARRWRNDRVLSSEAGPVASVSAWIANGVTLNFDGVAGTARRYFAIIIAGADVTAATGVVNAPTGTNLTQDITAPGFTPDLVLLHTAWTTAASDTDVGSVLNCWGAANRALGEQRCVAFAEASAVTSASNPVNAIYNNVALARFNGAVIDSSAVINDFDGSGFSIQYTGTTTNDGNIAWLALQFLGSDVKFLDLAIPGATGNQAYTGAGFEPNFGLTSATSDLAYNTIHSNDAEAASCSFGAFDGFAEATQTTRNDFNVDPSDNAELLPHVALASGTPTDPDATRANFVSFDSDGITLNYSAVSGNATLGWVILVGDTALPESPARVTQLARMTLVEMGASDRVTQLARFTLAEMIAGVRVTQVARLTLASYEPCLTRRANLWKIDRRDGVTLTFTSHDQDMVFGQHTYKACGSLTPSASENNADIEGISNTEFEGIISDEGIKETEVLAGLFDDAYVQVFLVAWEDPGAGPIAIDSVYRLMAGWVGEVSVGERGFRAEVLGPGAKLSQKSILETFTAPCRFIFGDPDTCGVDIDALKLTAEVATVTDNGEFIVAVGGVTGAAKYSNGFVRWTSGLNNGAECEIKEIIFLMDQAFIVLWAPAPFLPAIGDDLFIFPGCAKDTVDCKFYDNFINHGGFHLVPGNDEIGKTPDAKQ